MRCKDKKTKRIGDIAGIILAGGRNTRMGFDKAFIKLNSERIIDITIGKLREIFEEIIIVTNSPDNFSEFKDAIIVGDRVKGCGPLGGIHAGLCASFNKRAFFIACDMPFLHIDLIRRMTDTSLIGDVDCVIPCTDRGPEPLCGIYSKKILPRLEEALSEGEFSLCKFLKLIKCRYIEPLSYECRSFININTPEDLKEVETYANKI